MVNAMSALGRAHRRGFTLIELLVVLAIIGLLLSLVAPSYLTHVDRARDLTLKQDLKTVRDSLDKFAADQGREPSSLDELVAMRYLNALPVDPVTERTDTWVTTPDAKGGIHDLHSGATGNGQDGTPYASW